MCMEYIDADDSDSDTESITMENNDERQTVYAEVLYTFKAVGAEELSLERGALVEVLRIESGPWWLGRIKHDAILASDQSEMRQGWFPRDFVKVSISGVPYCFVHPISFTSMEGLEAIRFISFFILIRPSNN